MDYREFWWVRLFLAALRASILQWHIQMSQPSASAIIKIPAQKKMKHAVDHSD